LYHRSELAIVLFLDLLDPLGNLVPVEMVVTPPVGQEKSFVRLEVKVPVQRPGVVFGHAVQELEKVQIYGFNSHAVKYGEKPGIKFCREKILPTDSIVPSGMGFVNWRLDLAHPRFLRKEPMAEKSPEERGGSPTSRKN
jgi:hypothetical protein